MKGRDTIVEYVSNEGEKIRVVSGPVTRIGYRGIEEKYFKTTSTRIYVDGEIASEYNFEDHDLFMEWRRIISSQLEEFARAGADSNEIISAIDRGIANFYGMGESETDEDTSINI